MYEEVEKWSKNQITQQARITKMRKRQNKYQARSVLTKCVIPTYVAIIFVDI